MTMFTAAEIAAATGGCLKGNPAATVSAVSTDSRTAAPGQLFLALKGERFDGHEYIAAVAAKGVDVVVADRDWSAAHPVPAGVTLIAVSDTLCALGDLAAAYRKRFKIATVGITGSNGKTTTKEMLSSILELTGPGLKTAGNLNNLIGLPHMLFQLAPEHRWGVLEMGMSEFGEIDRLAEIAAPSVGIVTNAFPAHLETMKSVEGVAKAKGELFLRLPPGGTAIMNADAPLVSGLPAADGVRRLSFGLEGGDVKASGITSIGPEGQEFVLHLQGKNLPVRLAACGRHNVYNALAAAAAALALGVATDLIVQGLEAFRPYDKRFKPEKLGTIVLVDDSYNANPASVEAALVTLRDIAAGRAIAVLGDMLELGVIAEEAHRAVGVKAAGLVSRLYLLGDMAPVVAAGAIEGGMNPAHVIVAASHAEIAADLVNSLQSGDTVLVKGSRGLRMEKVAEELRSALGAEKG